jgi:hypothetical protein
MAGSFVSSTALAHAEAASLEQGEVSLAEVEEGGPATGPTHRSMGSVGESHPIRCLQSGHSRSMQEEEALGPAAWCVCVCVCEGGGG